MALDRGRNLRCRRGRDRLADPDRIQLRDVVDNKRIAAVVRGRPEHRQDLHGECEDEQQRSGCDTSGKESEGAGVH
jgi:hypothetical protein